MGRILILANSSGGLYDFRNELVAALLEAHQVFISVPDDTKTEELKREGCQVIQTPMNRRGINPVEDLALYRAYRKLMKEVQPDLVLTYTIKPNIYGGFCARRRRLPYLSTVTGLGTAFEKTGLLLWLVVRMYRAGLGKAACVFFQNEENRSIFGRLGILGKKERTVMGSGVNLGRHCYEPYPKREKVQFLYVGRVMEKKGILEYLEAAKALQGRNASFDILGYCDEDYQETLDEMERQGMIRQLGFHTEVHPYLTDTDAVVIPSFHEGMCNALLEAAATGRPVITTNISGCKETFEEGVSGFGFTPGKADELIRVMERFLALSYEERAQMGQAGRRKMEREFDRKRVTADYMEEIQQILAAEAGKGHN